MPANVLLREVKGMTSFGNKLEKILYAVGGGLLAFFTVLVTLDVGLRLLGYPVLWMQDVATFAYMWTIFLGSAIGLRMGVHYKIDVVRSNKLMSILVFICKFVFIIIVIYYGFQFAVMGLQRLAMPSGIPIFYSAISIPLGALFMLYFLIEQIREWKRTQQGGQD